LEKKRGNLNAKIVFQIHTQIWLQPLLVQIALLAKETWEQRLPAEIVQQERKKMRSRKNASYVPSANFSQRVANLSAAVAQRGFHKIKTHRRCAFPVFLAPTNLAKIKHHANIVKRATIPKTRNKKIVKSALLDGRRSTILGLRPVCLVHPVRTPTKMAPLYAKIVLTVDLIRIRPERHVNW
jgi:hypothetical protein